MHRSSENVAAIATALAKAVAMAATLSLERCMGSLHLDQIEADRA